MAPHARFPDRFKVILVNGHHDFLLNYGGYGANYTASQARYRGFDVSHDVPYTGPGYPGKNHCLMNRSLGNVLLDNVAEMLPSPCDPLPSRVPGMRAFAGREAGGRDIRPAPGTRPAASELTAGIRSTAPLRQ